jgi:hypothetical protein
MNTHAIQTLTLGSLASLFLACAQGPHSAPTEEQIRRYPTPVQYFEPVRSGECDRGYHILMAHDVDEDGNIDVIYGKDITFVAAGYEQDERIRFSSSIHILSEEERDLATLIARTNAELGRDLSDDVARKKNSRKR